MTYLELYPHRDHVFTTADRSRNLSVSRAQPTPLVPLVLRVLPALLVFASLSWPGALLAQPAAPAMSDEEQVTAIDTLVSFERSSGAEWARLRRSPANLEPADFTVRVDGVDHTVVGVEALEDAPPGRAEWTQMVYVDCLMTSRDHLNWAMSALADRAERLVELGPVEVVVAEPAPQTLLAASKDADLLRAVLGQLARRESCADLLSRLREEALTKIGTAEGTDAVTSRNEVAREALEAERTLSRSSRLALTTRLTDGLRREGGAQKALFLVHEGFDPDSDDVYAPFLGEAQSGATELLDDATQAQIVAAYGWTVVGLETREVVRPAGALIGSWFFYPDGGGTEDKTDLEEHMDVKSVGGRPVDDGDPWQSFLGGIRGKLKENRDVGKAESYLELGNALYDQGKYERAAESFEKALYHFADAPKTRDQQTLAMVQLGNALAAAGNRDRARHAIEAALIQDPALAKQKGAESLGMDHRGLGKLIQATAGASVRSPADLDSALTDLGGKTRLTFQIVGTPRGKLLSLEVDFAGPTAMAHAGWTRSSTPEEVAVARLLRLVDDELRDTALDDGEIDLSAARREDGSFDLGAAFEAAGISQPILRLTVAPGSVLRGLGTPTEQDVADLGAPLRVALPEGADYVVVLVEDLETGVWGAGLFGD